MRSVTSNSPLRNLLTRRELEMGERDCTANTRSHFRMTPTTQAAPHRNEGPPHDASNVTRILRPLMEVRRMPQEARYSDELLSDEEIHALNRISRKLTRVEKDIPHVLAVLPYAIQAIQQGMRSGTPGENGGVQSSDVTDRVFAEVAGREKGHKALSEIIGAVSAICDSTALLVALVTNQRRVADAETVRQAVDAVRCSGMGKQGYARGRHGEGWGDETCRRNAVHDGICSVCLDHRWAWVKDPTYVRPIDRRVGARLPSLAGIVDTGRVAGLARLVDTDGVQIEDVA